MLDSWEGGWDSGSSCCALAREAGIVGLHVGHLGRRLHLGRGREGDWDSGSSCCTLGRGGG